MPTDEKTVTIPPWGLGGTLSLPAEVSGVVVFAHGSGSSRFSPRNRYVAEALQSAGLGTLLFDLLTEAESADRRNVFDIPRLAERLVRATSWLDETVDRPNLRIGYFGSSTGAAAALVAAAAGPPHVAAVVSRGGRPDLAGAALDKVAVPTLLIVGALDVPVIGLNEQAYARLRCTKRLDIVPGASHLFEEPGTLAEVVRLARDWFRTWLAEAVEGASHVRG